MTGAAGAGGSPQWGTTSSSRDEGARRRRAGALLRWLALAALLLFLEFGDAPERTRFWSAFFEFGHAPLFGVIALVVRGLLAARAPGRPGVSWRAFGATVVLGAVTEVLQLAQPRHDASLQDLLRDAAGAAAFLLLRHALADWRPTAARASLARRAAVVGSAFVILLAAGADLLVTTTAYIARNRSFPTLYPLDGSSWESGFIALNHNHLVPRARAFTASDGRTETLARLDVVPGRYSGLSFKEPYPDWRGYRRLAFTLASDLDTPTAVTIRIHDAAHDESYRDRFNRRLVVAPGVNRYAIPLEDIRRAPARRPMDLARVRGIMLFAGRVEKPMHLYLGSFRLE